MQLESDEGAPVCRLRLEARWEDDGTVEGEVSQDLFWIANPPPTSLR
jgi:putative ATP-dependent endonuclease of OLD family